MYTVVHHGGSRPPSSWGLAHGSLPLSSAQLLRYSVVRLDEQLRHDRRTINHFSVSQSFCHGCPLPQSRGFHACYHGLNAMVVSMRHQTKICVCWNNGCWNGYWTLDCVTLDCWAVQRSCESDSAVQQNETLLISTSFRIVGSSSQQSTSGLTSGRILQSWDTRTLHCLTHTNNTRRTRGTVNHLPINRYEHDELMPTTFTRVENESDSSVQVDEGSVVADRKC